MAHCDVWTNQVGNSYCPQVHFEVWITGEDDTRVYIDWYMYYDAYGYAAYTNGYARTCTAWISGTKYTGSININGVTGTQLIAKGSDWFAKLRGENRWLQCSVSFGFDVTWNGVYGGTTSGSSGFSIGAMTSYTVSYNANGGTGAPSSQTKYYDGNITLSTSKPTRTGYSFQGWATSASGSVAYQPGATYSTNANRTLYAVWKADTYPVKYDANTGTGAPAAQTKTYGVDLKLSTTKPTKTNYNFLGWGTSAASTTVAYQPGGTYTKNSSLTLYAIWSLAYTKPRITNISINRSNSSALAVDDGTYATVRFDWETDKTVTSVKIEYKAVTSSTWTTIPITSTGTSATVARLIGGRLDNETAYDIRITVADSVDSTVVVTQIEPMTFSIDVKANGNGVAFGKPASLNNTVDSAWAFQNTINGVTTTIGAQDESYSHYNTTGNGVIFNKPIIVTSKTPIASGVDLNTLYTPGTYACPDAVAATLKNCPTTYGFSMSVEYSYINYDYITQKIFVPYYETEYSRRYIVNSNSWSTWKSDFAHDTGWLTLNNVIKYRRIGKTVYAWGECSGDKFLVNGSYTLVGTLPEGFRPDVQLSGFPWDAYGSSLWTRTSTLQTDGKISLYHKEGRDDMNYWRFMVSFPTNTSV